VSAGGRDSSLQRDLVPGGCHCMGLSLRGGVIVADRRHARGVRCRRWSCKESLAVAERRRCRSGVSTLQGVVVARGRDVVAGFQQTEQVILWPTCGCGITSAA
jgi:hypothetical protein